MLDQLVLLNEVQHLSIQELVDGFDGDTILFTDQSNYIRTDSNIEKCQESLIFPESDVENDSGNIPAYVQVLEPILFEVLPDGRKRLVNGNTRCKAVLDFVTNPVKSLMGESYEVTSYADIPYRVFNRCLTEDEYTRYQVGLNDSTQDHNSYELALSVVRTKLRLENEYTGKRNKAGGISKDGSAEITRKLCQLYKKSQATISAYVAVVVCSSPIFKKYLVSGKLSVDTANYIIQAADRNNLDVDLAIRNIVKSIGNDDESNITKTIAKAYFSDYEKSKLPVIQGQTTEQPQEKKVESDVEVKETDESDVIAVEDVNPVDSTSYILAVLENLKSLDINNIDDRLSFPLSEINKKMIKVIQVSYPYLEIDELTKQIYGKLVELVHNFSNIEGIDDSEIVKIINAFKGLDKELANFQKTKRQLEQSQVVLEV